jgi:subtilase family serine protease
MSAIACAARRAGLAVITFAALVLAMAAPAAAAVPASVHPRLAGRITARHACPALPRGRMACLAIVDATAAGRPLTRAQAAAAGLHPYMAADLQAAYKLPSSLLGEGQTIAIVDAYDDPAAAADLAVYRKANKLPACTTASGCFARVNQEGQAGHYPATDPTGGWEQEESLDLDMASAICPNCHLILVEATTNGGRNLYAAEDEAATLGANVISNSWGSTEYPGEAAECSHFDHPGIAITAGAGDDGFGVPPSTSFPAACASVTAVSGTTLYQDSSKRGWAETAWSYDPATGEGTGSGCSAYIAKPAWQHDKLCGMRTVGDVSAVADPDTPVAVYDTYGGGTGWEAFGGTSVATPIIAGVYALAGNTAAISPGASYLYAHHQHLYDVTSGSNASPGSSCGGSYLCTAKKGYDGPTGWGTPHGIGAF